MQDLEDIQTANSQRLHQYGRVVGTGIGQKQVDGRPTGQSAIIVFVDKKVPKSEFTSQADIIPEEIDGVPVDVIEVGKLVKQGFTNRVRPIQPGFSCGHGKITAGTIGGVFIDKDGDYVILSNCHVLANEGDANPGDPIFQPGPTDLSGFNPSFGGWSRPLADHQYCATLKSFIRLHKNGNTQDSAIAKIPTEYVWDELVNPIYPQVNRALNGFGTPVINQSVQKCGRTTGYTVGRVIALNAEFTIGYDFGDASFSGCVVTTAMSQGGDSGSILQDMNNNAVALLFAGSDKVSLHNPFEPVRQHYGLRLWEGVNKFSPISIHDAGWRLCASGGSSILMSGNNVEMKAKANQFCCLERDLSPGVSLISCNIFTGTDGGASWGPGIAVDWPNMQMKINLRKGDQYGVRFDGQDYTGWGRIKENTWYNMRVRFGGGKMVAEAEELGDGQDGILWNKLIEFPASVVPQAPIMVKLGKTDSAGNKSDHTDLGSDGEFVINEIKIT